MDTKEIIKYINHYICEDKTKSAIMLSGKWGSGKSYFIQHELAPKLGKQCVVVSLYGLSNLFEVSRSLYFELRCKFLNKKSEKLSAGKLLVKTVVKGVASHFGVDLSMSEKDLHQLYNSIDAKDKLIIFEDVERSKIEILDFLGFVNNLVEQDGCKVLLVANEEEFIKYEETKQKPKTDKIIDKLCERVCDNGNKIFTQKTEEYFRKKEKTISDTIQFKCNFKDTIFSIINSFDNKILKHFATDSHIDKIQDICELKNNKNLRAIIFACQKTVDIFNELNIEDIEFAKVIFFGILAFSLQMKAGEETKWQGSSLLSQYLGSTEFPLFHFCYHYIMYHQFLKGEMETAREDYRKYKQYIEPHTINDKDLNVLYDYALHTEQEVVKALQNIETKLKNNEIPYKEYGRISSYIVSLSLHLGIDITKLKGYLIDNLKGQDRELEMHIRFSSGIEISDDVKRIEYEELQEKMVESLNANTKNMLDFENIDIDTFCVEIYKLENRYMRERKFASLININNFIERLKGCSPSQINNVRRVFNHMYAPVNINEFLANDKLALGSLLCEVEKLLSYENFDKIQKLQCKWFVGNLENILTKFS